MTARTNGIAVTLLATCAIMLFAHLPSVLAQGTASRHSWWQVQSVDTMKYSRDLAREKKGDDAFGAVIDRQMENIAATGATHVAIATPYDEEFVPMLTKWIAAAKYHGLHIWFRGNFSGWEGWFNYPKISREDHIRQIGTFIRSHADLFDDGDIFTTCPECENGGPGDPRQTGDIEGHRSFLIADYQSATEAFRAIGKGVKVGYYSMNYDVARAIMDRKTTEALGNTVTIDHYVKDPVRMGRDITELANATGGNVFVGEFGAPIPDIHGHMTPDEQAVWLRQTLDVLAKNPNVVGVNYWVNVGGSTELWNEKDAPSPAVSELKTYFSPKLIIGRVVNQNNKPITNAAISTEYKTVTSDKSGAFSLPVLPDETQLIGRYKDSPIVEVTSEKFSSDIKIVLKTQEYSFWNSVLEVLREIFHF